MITFHSKMKWKIGLFVGLIAALSITASGSDGTQGKPILEIPSPRHDAGTHWEGEVVSHTFQVKNSGGEELRILSVKPG
jgi:hypothetical protein